MNGTIPTSVFDKDSSKKGFFMTIFYFIVLLNKKKNVFPFSCLMPKLVVVKIIMIFRFFLSSCLSFNFIQFLFSFSFFLRYYKRMNM